MKYLFLPLLVVLLTGCDNGLRSAELMSQAADDCVLAVRDKKQAYYETKPCRELGVHAGTYMDAARETWWKSTKAEILFESARGRAWMALSLHNAFHKDRPSFSIW
jgi:hypothetical protein